MALSKGHEKRRAPKRTVLHQNPLIDMLYETSLRCLCHDYSVFERCFGSETSLADASKVIRKKLAKLLCPTRQQDVAALRAPTAESEIDTTMTDATTKDGTEEEEGNKKTTKVLNPLKS
jgi:hypothetical protein